MAYLGLCFAAVAAPRVRPRSFLYQKGRDAPLRYARLAVRLLRGGGAPAADVAAAGDVLASYCLYAPRGVQIDHTSLLGTFFVSARRCRASR